MKYYSEDIDNDFESYILQNYQSSLKYKTNMYLNFFRIRTKNAQLKGVLLLVGAINRISKIIPVNAIGNTQIAINL